MPEFALDLLRLDLKVGNGGLEAWIPIHQPFVAIEQLLVVEIDEHLEHGHREALVHGEAFVGPVARRAEAAELAGDRAAALFLPFPDLVDEGLAREIGALLPSRIELALDHHLGRDAGMVGADHPERVLALQPGMADQHILQGVVEGVADMEAAGDVRRRNDDRIGLGIGPLGTEQTLVLPIAIPARLDRGGVESLVDRHDGAGFSGGMLRCATPIIYSEHSRGCVQNGLSPAIVTRSILR